MVKKAAHATPNDLLRRARKERGWTQQQVADQIGAPLPLNVTRWERGTAIPSPHYIQRLCQIFEKSARDLGLYVQEEVEDQSEAMPEATYWGIPYRRNPYFTGRKELLASLAHSLQNEQSSSAPQICVLQGGKGIGKTQIALEYAYRYRDSYNAVFWIRVNSQSLWRDDLMTLVSLLDLTVDQDQASIQAAVLSWLMRHRNWLLILDGADERTCSGLPHQGSGHILLTTRTQPPLACCFEVKRMDVKESMLLLLKRAKLLAPSATHPNLDARLLNQAQAIVQVLDGVPLAVEQAASYIEETGCGLEQYLELYQQRRDDLLKRQSPGPIEDSTISNMWQLALRETEQANPAAVDLLRLCAFLDADEIPERLITEGASLLGPLLAPVAADPIQLNEALRVLRRQTLIQRDSQGHTLGIHPLLQIEILRQMDQHERRLWAERAVKAVHAALPSIAHFQQWPIYQELLTHAQIGLDLIKEYQIATLTAVRLLDQMGTYLCGSGDYTQAEEFLELALKIYEENMAPFEHMDISIMLYDFATLYHRMGHFQRSEDLFLRALPMFEHTEGAEHVDTADCLNNLALLYVDWEKYEQAESLHQKALNMRERLLGPDHDTTGYSVQNLSVLYIYQGRYTQAESLLERARVIFERSGNLPLIAQTMHNLAALCDRQERYSEAAALYLQVVSMREEFLGANHPDLGLTIHNLGWCYYKQGLLDQAKVHTLRGLAILEHALGQEHNQTVQARYLLAATYHRQRKYEQAEPLYQCTLRAYEEKFGADHEDTVEVRQLYEQVQNALRFDR